MRHRIWGLRSGAVVLLDSCASLTEAMDSLRALNGRRVAAIAYTEDNIAAAATGHVSAAQRAEIERTVTGAGVLATRRAAKSGTPDAEAPRCEVPGCCKPIAPSTVRLDPRLRRLCKRHRELSYTLRAKGADVATLVARLSWPKPFSGLETLAARDARRAS